MSRYTTNHATATCIMEGCNWTYTPKRGSRNTQRDTNAARAARKHAQKTDHDVRVDRQQWQLVRSDATWAEIRAARHNLHY